MVSAWRSSMALLMSLWVVWLDWVKLEENILQTLCLLYLILKSTMLGTFYVSKTKLWDECARIQENIQRMQELGHEWLDASAPNFGEELTPDLTMAEKISELSKGVVCAFKRGWNGILGHVITYIVRSEKSLSESSFPQIHFHTISKENVSISRN